MIEDEDDAPALPAAKGRRAPAGRRAVVEKLWRAARRQIAAHERHLAALPEGRPASESDAKALAVLARTVRELVALDGQANEETKAPDDPASADGLRYAATLRAELARRLEALAARELGAPAAADPAGAEPGPADAADA